MQYNPEDLRPHRYGFREQDLRVIGRRSLSRALAEKMFSESSESSESSERTIRRLRGGGARDARSSFPSGGQGVYVRKSRKIWSNPELRKPYEDQGKSNSIQRRLRKTAYRYSTHESASRYAG